MRLPVDEVYKKYADRLFSAAFSVCQNQADADDVVQDTFVKYCTARVNYSDEEHIKAWLLRVAINRAKDIRSTFWRKNKVSWEEYVSLLVFEEPEDEHLFEAVMSLPQKYRMVIHLYYYEEYPVSEIADILHLREGTVKSQLHRGRALLKKMLVEEWNDDE